MFLADHPWVGGSPILQYRFTRLIVDIDTLPYGDGLKILKLTTLAERVKQELVKQVLCLGLFDNQLM